MSSERDIVRELRKAEEMGCFKSAGIGLFDHHTDHDSFEKNDKLNTTIFPTEDKDQKYQCAMFVNKVFDHVAIPLCIIGENHVVLHCNHSFETFSKFSKHQVEGISHWYDFIADTQRDQVIEQFTQQKHIMKKDVFDIDCSFVTNDEQVKSVQLSIEYIPRSATWVVSFIDLTKIKRSERKFHHLYDVMNEGVAFHKVIRNDKGNIVNYQIIDVNPSFESILEVKKNSILGKKATDAYQVEQAPFLEKYASVVESNNPISFETYFPPMDKYFRISAVPTDTDQFATIFVDTTEQKKSAEEIKKFKVISDNSSYGNAIADFDGNIRYINDYFAKVHGYSVDDLSGENLSIFYNDEQLEVVAKIHESLKGKNRYGPIEVWHTHRDGTAFPMLMSGVVIDDYESNDQYIAATAIDISKQKKIEGELRRSEKKFRLITENSADAIFITNAQGKYQYVNNAACEMLGYSFDELTQMSIADLTPKEDLEKEMKKFQQLMKLGKMSSEIELIRKDGTLLQADLNAVVLPNGLIYGSCRDISEKKKAEIQIKQMNERLSKIFKSSPSAIMTVNTQGLITGWSPACEDIFGWTADEVMGRFNPLISDEMKHAYLESIKRRNVNMEVKVPRKDHGMVDALLSTSPLFDDAGTIEGGLGILTDISNQKKAERKYKALFDSSRDAIMTISSADFRFTSGNTAAISLFKAKDDSMFTSIHPWDVSPKNQPDGSLSEDKAKKMMNKALNEGSHYFDWIHTTLDGEKFFATVLLTKVEIEKDKPFLQATIRDVTEQKKKEREIRKSEEKFKTLFDSSTDAFCIHSIPDLRILDVNEEACKRFGYSKEEFKKLSIDDISVTPDFSINKKDNQRNMQQVFDGDVQSWEWLSKTKSGEQIWHLMTLKVIEIDGVKRLLAQAKDITDMKKAQEELQKKFEELQRWKKLTVGRELRMKQLKDKIRELEKKKKTE